MPLSLSPGTDNIDAKLLRVTTNQKPTPIPQCLMYGVCTEVWKESKVIPLPKDKTSAFTGPNSRPISFLPVLSQLLEIIVSVQIQHYLS